MAYRFKLTEPFDDGVRRIGRQQIDRALGQLKAEADPAAAIHATRKALKRIRALLRLARPGLGEETFRTENTAYRDIGRLLATARDRQVLLETVTKLELASTGRTKRAFASARARLATTGDLPDIGAPDTSIGEAVARLEEARARLAGLDIAKPSFDVAWEGLERAYRQAARAFDHAYATLDDEAIHDWRKRVQCHWRHMALLAPAWPELLDARIATARQLSSFLGEDHDIAVMSRAVDAGSSGAKPPASHEGLVINATSGNRKLMTAFAAGRQRELRAKARTLGLRLFAESAGAFRERMELYWASAGSSEPPGSDD